VLNAKTFVRSISSVNEWVGKACSLFLVPLVCIMLLEVILRYAFDRPTIWAWDISMMLMALTVVLPGGYLLLKDSHINMDIIVRRLSPKTRAIIDLATSVLFFFVIGLLVWKGGEGAWDSLLSREHLSTVFAPPIYPLKMVWPVAAFLLLLQGVAKFIRDLDTIRQHKKDNSQ
jgi:TRAP-type mannitol/chloroaromatic compound transport system permease small subunit